MEGEGGRTDIFQFQGILGAVARIERSRSRGGCHDSLVSGTALVANS